jgi:NAD(P)-dependent dehydrogenase (short-subunit alcohol dehydrogenase family)
VDRARPFGVSSGGALVTGGTAGIGRACVERFRREGREVVFTGRDERRGRELATASGATFMRCDVTDRSACDEVLAAAIQRLGRVEVAVANAGVLHVGPLAETGDEALATLVEVHLTAPFRLARDLLAHLRGYGGGSLVVLSSEVARRGSHRIPAYSVVKAGSAALAEVLAAECAGHGIRVNAVCPTNTLPGMAGDDAGAWRRSRSGAYPHADDVAAAVSWLASDEASHVSGAALLVDAGNGAAFTGSLLDATGAS